MRLKTVVPCTRAACSGLHTSGKNPIGGRRRVMMMMMMMKTVKASVKDRLLKKLQNVETHWHDHSLESAWGALSDGAISFSIEPLLGGKTFYEFF
jgi:hypothetical protein